MDKESECEFLKNFNVFGLDDKPCCYLYMKYCEDNNDCYYKRLKRKEQECDELKNKSDYWKDKYADVHIRFTNQISELKEENAEYDTDLYIEKESHKNDLETLDKYRKALENIREYCEEQNLKADYTACEILDIITKAEEENE